MYLGNQGLVAIIIASKFLQDDCPFLLGAIKANNSSPLPFQAHLRWAHDLPPLTIQASIPPIEQLLERGMDRFQENILKSVHKHSFSSIISKLSLNFLHNLLKSYASPSSKVWLYVCLVIPSFRMASNILSSTLCTRLGLLHPTIRSFSQCICGQAIDLTWIHVFRYAQGGERTVTHDAIRDSFTSIVKDVKFQVLRKQTHVLLMPSLQSSQ